MHRAFHFLVLNFYFNFLAVISVVMVNCESKKVDNYSYDADEQ